MYGACRNEAGPANEMPDPAARRGGQETNLMDIAAGLDPDTLVVFPRGPLPMGAQQFAWFRVAFTASGPRIVPEEAERSRTTLIAGFSQGGILSASVALSAPESVVGFAVLSGLKAFSGHGTQDSKLPVDWAHRSDACTLWTMESVPPRC